MRWGVAVTANPGHDTFAKEAEGMTWGELRNWLADHVVLMAALECDGNLLATARRLRVSPRFVYKHSQSDVARDAIWRMREAARKRRVEQRKKKEDQGTDGHVQS